MITKIENFTSEDINVKSIKQIFTFIFIAIILICAVILLPQVNSILIKKAESVRSIESMNTTWQSVIISFALSGIIFSVVFLCGFYFEKISLKGLKSLYGFFTLVLLLFISFISYRYGSKWLNSDHSSEMVLSKLLSQENKLMSVNWYYSTELRIIYQQIFMIPLFKLLSDWHLIRAITIFLNNLLVILSYLFMMNQTNVKSKWIMLSSMFLLIPVNGVYFNIVLFGGFYSFFIALFFLCMGIFLFLIKRTEKVNKGINWFLILFLLLALVQGISGIRSFMDIYLPLLFTCILFYKFKYTKDQFPVTLGILSIVLCIIGYFANILLYFVFNFESDLNAFWDSIQDILFQKLGSIIWFLPQYMGFADGSALFTPPGIFSVFSLLLSAALIIIPCILISVKSGKAKNIHFTQLFILLFFLVSVAYHIILYLLIESKYVTLRYFIPVFIFYIPVLAVFFENSGLVFKGKIKTFIIIIICITVFGQGGLKFQQLISADDLNAGRQGYISFLENNKMNFGFATFWNANVTTELSNGKITMAGIEIKNIEDENQIKHATWLTDKKYENPQYSDNDVFILLAQDEWNELGNNKNIVNKSPVYDDGQYVIITYPSTKLLHEQLIN